MIQKNRGRLFMVGILMVATILIALRSLPSGSRYYSRAHRALPDGLGDLWKGVMVPGLLEILVLSL
jgi:hypothetical protein